MCSQNQGRTWPVGESSIPGAAEAGPLPSSVLGPPYGARLAWAQHALWSELERAGRNFPRAWASPEEGAMILREELDELWVEVRANRISLARQEVTQVGAMGLRYIVDLAPTTAREAWSVAMCREPAVGPAHTLASAHEAFGYLQRSYDALWSASLTADPAALTRATDIAALSVRFLVEVGGDADSEAEKV